MTFTKSILLGSGAALMAVAGAQAADLPSRKAAPVEYVRVCDAYGAGFFFIPGTQTCLRIGGRVRADYAFVPAKTIYSAIDEDGVRAVAGTLNSTGSAVTALTGLKDSQYTFGWEARGRINVDARTQTPWGTVQTAFQLRMNRTSGVLNAAVGDTGPGTASTLESAFIRFAGFTFGAAADNFAYMPSLVYGAAHWASFGNGAKQIAYTHTFGGGLAATLALQDYRDTSGSTAWVNATSLGTSPQIAATNAPYYVHNSLPQVVGRVQWAQGWGDIALMGAAARLSAANTPTTTGGLATVNGTFKADKTVWALGAGAKINLPVLASGSALWLTANYANGMTEYTTRYTSFTSTAFARDVGGFQMNHPSVVLETDRDGVDRIDTVKSWNVGALLQHFWAPQYRSILFASYGALDAPTAAATRPWSGTAGFGDAKVWNVGTQFAWLPTRDFEIGVEVIYSRVNQDVQRCQAAIAANVCTPYESTGAGIFKASDSNFTGRLRVERNF